MKHAGLFVNAVTQVMKLHLVSSVAFKEISAKKGCAMQSFKATLPKCGICLNVYEAKYKLTSTLPKLFTLSLILNAIVAS